VETKDKRREARGRHNQENSVRGSVFSSLVACCFAAYVLDGRCAEPQNSAHEDLTAKTNDGSRFRQEDVSFNSTRVKLNGTLTYPLPGSRPKHPAIILVHGTGSTDRDGTFPTMKLTLKQGNISAEGEPLKDWSMRIYKQIAEGLSANGFAVLRFDKRGWAEGGNDKIDMTLDLLCDDVKSALSYLRTRDDIDHEAMFVLGHSEGGIIAQKLAADLKWLRGIILLASPITPLHELTHDMTAYILRLRGVADDEIQRILDKNRQDYEAIRRGEYSESTLGGVPTMHWRSLILHDPLTALRECPPTTGVLILNGAKDWQIPPKEAITIYSELKNLNHENVELHIFSMLDHNLLEETGVSRVENYFVKRRNTPAYVIDTVSQWLYRTCHP
jgi:hypothetical protein